MDYFLQFYNRVGDNSFIVVLGYSFKLTQICVLACFMLIMTFLNSTIISSKILPRIFVNSTLFPLLTMFFVRFNMRYLQLMKTSFFSLLEFFWNLIKLFSQNLVFKKRDSEMYNPTCFLFFHRFLSWSYFVHKYCFCSILFSCIL